MKKVIVASLVTALVVVTGCKKEKKSVMDTATETAATSTAAKTTEADRAVITINGEKVTESLFLSAASGLPRQMQEAMQTPQGKKALADEIIRIKLLEQEGRRTGVANDEEVKNSLNLMSANIIASATLRKLVDQNLSEAELKQIYEKDKSKYDVIRARQIVIAYAGGQLSPKQGEPPTEAAAMAKAQAIVERLKKGENFAAIARAESDDVNAAQSGGTIRFVRGSAPPQLEAELLKLQTNGVTPPVKTAIAIHVMQLMGRDARTFDQVKSTMAQQLQEERLDKILEDLKKKAKVDYDESFFGAK